MNNFIRLDDCCYGETKITFQFSSDLPIFKTNNLFIDYSSPLPKRIDSIAAIPFLALVAPLGWLTGCEIIIPEIDETYLQSLTALEKFYRTWHPDWSFNHTIQTKPCRNHFAASRHGLLFSLGVDSLVSFIKHRGKNIFLLTVIGIETALSPERNTHWKQFEERVTQFRKSQGAEGVFIQTNINHVIDPHRLRQYGFVENFGGKWWGSVAHALDLTAVVAPFSYDFLKTLYIASTGYCQKNLQWGSTPEMDNHIAWASTQVQHDGDNLNRNQKIKTYFKSHPEMHPYLTICSVQYETPNCTSCPKCLLTIIGLLADNIDPADCGFPITAQTLGNLKQRLLYDIFFYIGDYARASWIDIRDTVEPESVQDRYGARSFFKWLKNYSLKKNLLKERLRAFLWSCRTRHPRNKFAFQFYQFFMRRYRTYSRIFFQDK